ncbi:MAG: mechanosensitive ion channel family protein [Bacillota bacterium]
MEYLEYIELVLESINLIKIIYSIIIVFLIIIFKGLINKYYISRFEDLEKIYRWRKTSTYISVIMGLIFISLIWMSNFRIGTFLGLFSAGLAIALRDLLANFVGWIFIIWRRPFSIGDRVEIKNRVGDIVDIRIFQFSVIEIRGKWIKAEQSTGRIIHIPNKDVFNHELTNYTADFPYIWEELEILVTFESNWQKAKEIILDSTNKIVEERIEIAKENLRRSSRKYMVYYGKLTPIVYTSVENSGVLLTARYLCAPRERRDLANQVWEEVLIKFKQEPDINLAYPTRRLYYQNNSENDN